MHRSDNPYRYARRHAARGADTSPPSQAVRMSMNNGVAINSDGVATILATHLRHLFLVYEFYKAHAERIIRFTDIETRRSGTRYEVEIASPDRKQAFTVKVNVADDVVIEYGRELHFD